MGVSLLLYITGALVFVKIESKSGLQQKHTEPDHPDRDRYQWRERIGGAEGIPRCRLKISPCCARRVDAEDADIPGQARRGVGPGSKIMDSVLAIEIPGLRTLEHTGTVFLLLTTKLFCVLPGYNSSAACCVRKYSGFRGAQLPLPA